MMPLQPQYLVTPRDSEPMRVLFGETLRRADAMFADRNRSSLIPPGPLWLLARMDPPPEHVDALFAGEIQPRWPLWFERNRGLVMNAPLRQAFLHCIAKRTDHGIDSGFDLCRVLAAVSQTLYSSNREIVLRNRALAGQPVPAGEQQPEWSNQDRFDQDRFDQDRFVRERPDEQGISLTAGHLGLWLASHIGPATGRKTENQDAVCAMPCGAGLCFALADGVSTSLGSRYAAAIAAHSFCEELARSCAASPVEDGALMAAAAKTQTAMQAVFERVCHDPDGMERHLVMEKSVLQPEAAEMILDNTRTAKKAYLPSAMATTLIGGYVQPEDKRGQFSGSVICIGDGAVEAIDADGSVHAIQVTDPDETMIDQWMGPGVRAQEVLRRGRVPVHSFSLADGQYLLLSSDGLTRGHRLTVWSKVSELTGDIRPRLQPDRKQAAAQLLDDLARAAEASPEKLFADNLSLILVAAG